MSETNSFEEALEKLEKSVERLETGDLKLDEALTTFEQGIAASRSCGQWLDQARKRVQVLIAEGEEEFKLEFLDEEDEA
jgi:exodeoxyribonuclease VII small subunit